MEKVIFLDRDGTLNEEVNYLHRKEDLVLLPGVPEALKSFKDQGYRLVVVTNQAGVARGYYTEDDVKELHPAPPATESAIFYSGADNRCAQVF